jgi:hypothetical protein
MADITVPVPDDRIAEFYQFFGLWLAGSLILPSGGYHDSPVASGPQPQLKPWGDSYEDYADAEALWKKFSARARAMFGLLIDNPGKEFTGEQIAEACDIPNGRNGVAGVLAWPGRHGWAISRGLPTEWREDQDAQQSYYWIPADRAEVFKAAREKVEGATD